MSLPWVGAAIRGRGLVGRGIGWEAARRVAAAPTLPAALDRLGSTAYGRYVRAEHDLPMARQAVGRAALWHLRVLAGWGPALDARAFRAMVSDFEVANLTGQARRIMHGGPAEPYMLGSLATAWPRAVQARTMSELRDALRSSDWGDPGVDDGPGLRLSPQLAAARRILDDAPGAADWATARAALTIARTVGHGAGACLGPPARRDATRVLGRRWERATSIPELVPLLPRPAAGLFESIGTVDDLWRAEARAWLALGRTATVTLERRRFDLRTSVGAASLLIADAWLVGAALAVAEAGGGVLEEVLGAQP